MPKLPDKESVYGQRTIPQANRPLVTADLSAGARAQIKSGEMLSSIGEGVKSVGADLQRQEKARQDAEDEYEYLRAENLVKRKMLDIKSKYQEDTEYSTHETRFMQDMAGLAEAGRNIKTPEKQMRFQSLLNDVTISGLERVREGAKEKRKNMFLGAEIEQSAFDAEILGNALANKDIYAVSDVLKNYKIRNQKLAEMGVIDQEAAAKAIYQEAPKLLKTAISSLPPERQIEVLGVGDDALYKSTQEIDVDLAASIMFMSESGGKQIGGAGSVAGADEPTTSLSGAIGIAQVMPATAPEAAKLAGLEWDENKYKFDAKYNAALGKAYLQKQIDDFENLPMAFAAYNAGPGATKQALAKAERAGNKDAWLSYLPDETKNYVSKNIEKYVAKTGGFENPVLQILPFADRQELRSKALKVKEENQSSIQTSLLESLMEKYRNNEEITSEEMATLKPEYKTRLVSYMENKSGIEPVTVEERMERDNRFDVVMQDIGSGALDLTKLTTEQFSGYMTELNPDDYDTLEKMRQDVLLKKEDPQAKAASVSNMNSVVNMYFHEDKKDTPQKKANMLRALVMFEDDFRAKNQRAPSQKELIEKADDLIKAAVFKARRGNKKGAALMTFSDISDPVAVEEMIEQKSIYIDQETREKIYKELNAAGNESPTSDDIESVYIDGLIKGIY